MTEAVPGAPGPAQLREVVLSVFHEVEARPRALKLGLQRRPVLLLAHVFVVHPLHEPFGHVSQEYRVSQVHQHDHGQVQYELRTPRAQSPAVLPPQPHPPEARSPTGRGLA